ncbi:MAG TPA: cytochrome c oxidase subunit 3 [Pyrinomonadaceae bacterium]|jgi:cytochrome c oxidase subunit 3|nr:cytochrome c oxidase subunit 3 [Pyrinomonadaceae bacterium]
MATTVTNTRPLTTEVIGGGPKRRGPDGNGGPGRNGLPDSQASFNRYRLGMWVALASVVMLFTSLSSAYIVRAASSSDWHPLPMPRILLLSTALILISSGTLEAARRQLKGVSNRAYRPWLLVTLVLGIGFLVSQLMAWRQLVRQGVYVASNPHSSFFYLLTAAHGVHLLGGLLALGYLLLRGRAPKEDQVSQNKSQAKADAVTIYWHFMDFLWLYLFVLLFYVR